MSEIKKFTASIEQAQQGMDAAYIKIPFDVKKVYGKARVKVIATFDGVEYLGSITTMDKNVGSVIGVLKEIRQQIGKSFGDKVEVMIKEDDQPRTVEIPGDLQKALDKNPQAKKIFDNFAYTHKKEYVRWIAEVKKPETRERRLARTIEMLTAGKKFS